MIYDFYILTTEGMKDAIVESQYDFSETPFGVVPYRERGSCTVDQTVLYSFWDCVDVVLSDHNLSSTDFISAIRAYSDGKLYGIYE
jgi:hypothetical protein